MRVLYDVSVLGMSALDSRARTGVFRTVEGVAEGLAASGECDLSFCAGGPSFYPVYGALRYLEADTRFTGVPFVSAGVRERATRRLLDGFWPHTREVEPGTRLGIGARAMRKVAVSAFRAVADRPHPVDASELRGVDVYHSPHGPLPPRTPGARPVRFITVYDLIAVFSPELFNPNVPAYVRSILESIGAEDRVICISEATRRDLCGLTGMAPERVVVTPLAASRELFHRREDPAELAAVRARYGIPDAPYVLSLNTLEPRKNLGTAVRAFARLVEEERIGDLYLVLVGARGWDFTAIFEAVERFPAARGRVLFPGYVADADLAALYSGALAFVYPSLYEGFGLPPLEAMQCGVPVVASNTSALPEVVGGAGLMVSPDDVDGFAAALGELYRDGGLRGELSRRSLARAAEFSWERCTRETIAAYRAALDE
ncbi:MAG TPA: glycosyltransferase family 1 protein [Longimicrobiaceae bacterium]|nr:glycosyltransferase family 1 protein [Longimicrobiaceae bacterium]